MRERPQMTDNSDKTRRRNDGYRGPTRRFYAAKLPDCHKAGLENRLDLSILR